MSTSAKRIRSGLYEVEANGTVYSVEDIGETAAVWRVTDTGPFFDGWIGDYATKREALKAISEIV